MREHLHRAARVTGRPDERLLLRPPPGTEVLFEVFGALHNARPQGMSGPSAIPQSEVAAYQANRAIRLDAWELDCLQSMDAAVLLHLAASARKAKA